MTGKPNEKATIVNYHILTLDFEAYKKGRGCPGTRGSDRQGDSQRDARLLLQEARGGKGSGTEQRRRLHEQCLG